MEKTAGAFPGIWLSCALILTAFLLLPCHRFLKLGIGAAAGLVLVLLLFRRSVIPTSLSLILLGISICGFSSGFFDTLRYEPVRHCSGSNMDTQAWVLDYGVRYDDRVRVQLLVMNLNGEKSYPFLTYIYLPAEEAPQAGMQLEGRLHYAIPRDTADFAHESYYRAHRIYVLAETRGAYTLNDAAAAPLWVSLRYIFPARCAHWFHERLLSLYSPEDAGILLSLILGDKSALPAGFEDDMRDVGLSHVMAVSGMNVSLISGIFLLLFFRRRPGAALAIPAVVLFTFITGAGASVVRAALMQIILLAGLLLFEKVNPLNSLFVTAGIMIFLNPYAVQDAGLWLSFLSTLGLILCGRRLEAVLMQPFREKPYAVQRLIRIPVSMAAATLTAQIFVLPLLVFLFGSFSLIAPLANLLVLWATELAFALGIVTALLSPILPRFAAAAAVPVSLLVRFQRRIVPVMARWPISVLHTSDPYVVIGLVLFYLFILLLFLCRSRRYLVFAFSLCAATLCLLAFFSVADAERSVTLTSLNLQGGQCTILLHGDDCVVVNCGGIGAAERTAEYLRSRQVRDIDLLIVTDYKSASSGGVPALSGMLPVHTLLLPYTDDPAAFPAAAGNVQVVTAPAVLRTDEISVTLLVSDETGFDAHRMAAYAQARGCSILVPGSIGADELSGMLGKLSGANFVVAGDYYSTHQPPFAADWYLLTGYMGVSRETVNALQERGMTVVDQSEAGDVTFSLR